jgi:Flp pilus assembly protein TadB
MTLPSPLPDPKSEWTIETLRQHWLEMDAVRRLGDERFQAERDRRYAEVALEREKALRIKEDADKAALGLAREIQTYKDEKANELRSQIERERGTYVTQSDLTGAVEKLEATIQPIAQWIASQQGGHTVSADRNRSLYALAGLVIAVVTVAVTIVVATR